jgi:hypothetical protein
MNDERIQNKMVSAYLGYYPGICQESYRKTTKTSVRIIGTSAKIQTEHLLNTGLSITARPGKEY